MRRIITIAALVAVTAGCTTSNNFHTEGGNCYRTREQSFIGWTYHTEDVAALPQNCEGNR
jgi:hypothetical protein